MASQTSGNQVLHDQLEKAKETLGRLRCINGFTPTCCTTSQIGQGCRRHTMNDGSVEKCSERSRHSREVPQTGVNSSYSSVDLQRLHKQIDSLEESVRAPILHYVESIEQQNANMIDAIETVRRQLRKHERVCPAMNISSGNIRKGSESCRHESEYRRNESGDIRNGSENLRNSFESSTERETSVLKEKHYASEKAGRESRVRAENLEKEVDIYREKLQRSEERVKELFRNISQMQPNATPAPSNEVLLENQLRHQQKLTETYFKDSTAKDKELSFLTIEKYNLESEVTSLVTDLESTNRKRDELSQEKQVLESSLVQSRQTIDHLEEQLREAGAEIQRLKSQFHDVLNEERARKDKISESQNIQEKQIKGLRKKCKKYEEYRSSHGDVAKQLEAERDEVLGRARHLSNEYKIKVSECKSLREENQRLTKEMSGVHIEASLSKTEQSNSKAYINSLKCELKESKSVVKMLQDSLQESKINESMASTEVAAFNDKESSLNIWAQNAEKERLKTSEELKETKGRETVLRNKVTQMKEKDEASVREIKELSQHCLSLENDLKVSKEKYFQIKKMNDELLLNKDDAERSQESMNGELTQLRSNHEELSEKNGKLNADLKAYKRIVSEKESQLKNVGLELARLHKAKDVDLKEVLKKDREIAFLKARVSSTERGTPGSARGGGTGSSRGASMNGSGNQSKDVEIYVERIVELETECKAQCLQIDELLKQQYHARKDSHRSDSLKEELASQDEEIQRLKREVSRSKQVIDDLRDAEERCRVSEDEKRNLAQEVGRLQSKVEEVSKLKQVCEQKEEEMRALKRMSSDEIDLEGKFARLKDRCREKDVEIEELHQKVIALQVKIKDFMQQNSLVEEQMRSVKEKYSIELGEKEKISQALMTTETKYRTLEGDLEKVTSRNEALENELAQRKRQLQSLGSEKEESAQRIEELMAESKSKEVEVEEFRKKVEELENVKIENVEKDVPDGESTPLNNSLESPRLTLSRNGRTSAYERLEVLEEENIQLLNRQSELEEELDAAEQHADELKNTLKSKRETVNELHAEMDGLKERVKAVEKNRDEMSEENEQLQKDYLLSQQKIEDMRVSTDRYLDESDELEKALTMAEKKIEELEKKLEEVLGKCASSEGQLQSVTERLARKEKELEVVETHVDEQRKLCDGYKGSAAKQESLVEKLRVEKVSAEETFLAMKLEVAKKEGTYKAGKEKIAELQTQLYETEDKFSSKTNECKKLSRDNERLKREMNELESKMAEQQSQIKKRMAASEVEKPSGVYNTKFLSLNTAVKGNSQNVEGLDTKLNSAQSKISTLEVELANDLRKFSLHRTASDVSRRGYSASDNQLGVGLRRPRSQSTNSVDDRESLSSISPLPRAESVSSFDGEYEYEEELDFNIPSVEVNHVEDITHEDKISYSSVSRNSEEQDEYKVARNDVTQASEVDFALSQADPFFTKKTDNSPEQPQEHFTSEMDEALINEAAAIFRSSQDPLGSQAALRSEAHVEEVITSQTAVVTGNVVSTTLPGNWNEEELIYF